MERLNQWLVLLANVGVLIGIIFLAFEIRQNTEMMMAQTRDAMTEKQMLLSEWIGTNQDVADIYRRGLNGELIEGTTEALMFRFLYAGIWREWENSYYQYESGLFDEAEFEPRRTRWATNMSFPGVRSHWDAVRQMYAEGFRNEIDAIVEQTPVREKWQ